MTGANTTGQRNGSVVLTNTTVSNDSAADAFFGGSELDWFVLSAADGLGDRAITEVKTLI